MVEMADLVETEEVAEAAVLEEQVVAPFNCRPWVQLSQKASIFPTEDKVRRAQGVLKEVPGGVDHQALHVPLIQVAILFAMYQLHPLEWAEMVVPAVPEEMEQKVEMEILVVQVVKVQAEREAR